MSGNDWPEVYAEELKTLWSDGWTAAQISRHFTVTYSFNVSRSSVCAKVNRLGLRRGVDGNVDLTARQMNGHQSHVERPAKPAKPAPLRIVAPAPVEPAPTGPLNDFPEAGYCRFIKGDPALGDWQCCGAPGFPYCDFHRGVVWIVPTGKGRGGKEAAAELAEIARKDEAA